MEQVIKFRGKRIDNNDFTYGYFIAIQNKEHYILEDCVLGLNHVEVIPESVGQFTGLLDKHGKEIYCGDILKGVSYNTFSKGQSDNYEVIWGIDGWHIKGTYFSIQELRNYCNNDIEIIGNIHQI